MTSKLGLHYQNLPSWHKSCRVPWVKAIDPPATNPWPWAAVLGRVWIGGDDVEREMIWQGKAGAQKYYQACLPAYECAPYVHAWEGPNEPHPLADANFRRALRVFTIEWTRLMHVIGRRVIVGCFSVGWSDVGHAPEFADMLAEADYFGLREYSAPAMWDNETWRCLRYRRTVKELQDAKARIPPIIIGECGIDGGVLDDESRGRGWRSYATRGQYEQQLAWYDERLCEDALVWCATPFVSGPTEQWRDFDVDEGLVRWIASWHTTMDRPAPAAWLPATGNVAGLNEVWLAQARTHKIRYNRNAGLSQAIEAMGQEVKSNEWIDGGITHQWGLDVPRLMWHLWSWTAAAGVKRVHSEPMTR